MRTFEKGDRTEAVVLAALAKAGYTVLIPFGVARYDLAIDDRTGERIKTVQCKTGRIREDCVVWSASSVDRGTQVRSDYRGQVDYFGVWAPGTSEVYLVPVAEVGRAEGRLRLGVTKNNQASNVRWARDYVLTDISGV